MNKLLMITIIKNYKMTVLKDNIFNVMNYDTYHIEIDFNKPKESN